jgi:chromate transporter
MELTVLIMKRTSPPGLWNIFITWLIIGAQSFGGGTSTLYLIRQACLTKGWMDDDEFIRNWGLVQISPGINLIKLIALIGYHLRGWPGLAVSMIGLLLPSATTTVLMTVGFTVIRSQPLVKAAMHGILPATIGLSLAMSIQMAQPLLSRARREGSLRMAAQIVVLLVAAMLLVLTYVSPVVVLLLSGTSAVLLLGLIPVSSHPLLSENMK